ncbi:hypothetical protein F5Y16DRAFT_417120 [Xylariaceae sp. FL0255]|nr:hypothetical protein F5Y16DRAFT_417120 [Xylariaceae sp. FL0255]
MISAPALSPDISQGSVINAVAWTGASISTICVALRLYSRIFVIQAPGWDDPVIVVAAVLNIVTKSLCSVAIVNGLGRHSIYLSSRDISRIVFYTPIFEATGITAYCLPKVAIVIFIRRLMGTAKRAMWILYVPVIGLFISLPVAITIVFLQCNPPGEVLHPFAPKNGCIPLEAYTIFNTIASVWSALADLVLAAFPIFLLWKLQMGKSRKLIVMAIMALGSLAAVAAVIKTTQLPKQNSSDATYELFTLLVSVFLEIDLCIMAACVPAFPKLWQRVFGKRKNWSHTGRFHHVAPSRDLHKEFDDHYEEIGPRDIS